MVEAITLQGTTVTGVLEMLDRYCDSIEGKNELTTGLLMCNHAMREAAEIIRALSAQAIGAWETMETAPKDGTRILARWGGVIVITYWAERNGFAGWQPPAMMPIKVYNKSAWNPVGWKRIPAEPDHA